MKTTTPYLTETATKIGEVTGIIFAIILIIAFILIAIYCVIYSIKTDELKQEFCKKLNEHDKAVVLEYKNTYWRIKKHKNESKQN